MPQQHDEFFVQRFLRAIRARSVGEPVPQEVGSVGIIPVIDVGPLFSDYEAQRAAIQSVAIPGNPTDVIASGDLWIHAAQRTSGAGAADQFSGVIDSYVPKAATAGITRMSLVYLRVKPSIDAALRLYTSVRNAFGAPADLKNIINPTQASTAGAHPWGAEDALSQTNAPDTTTGPNDTSVARGGIYRVLPANAVFELGKPDGSQILATVLVPGSQLAAVRWGVWGLALATAITVDYTAIVQVTPSP